MKKYISVILCLICISTLAACGQKADPVSLPPHNEITSVDITVGGKTVSHSDKAWISETAAEISASEPTARKSVQDTPQVKSYIKIDIRAGEKTTALFAYGDDGKYYIEQPYQGIYRIDKKLYERLRQAV